MRGKSATVSLKGMLANGSFEIVFSRLHTCIPRLSSQEVEIKFGAFIPTPEPNKSQERAHESCNMGEKP